VLKNAISLCIIRFNRFINVNNLFVIILSIKSQTKNIYRGTRIGEFLGPIQQYFCIKSQPFIRVGGSQVKAYLIETTYKPVVI